MYAHRAVLQRLFTELFSRRSSTLFVQFSCGYVYGLKKGETIVHGYHCPGDMATSMCITAEMEVRAYLLL